MFWGVRKSKERNTPEGPRYGISRPEEVFGIFSIIRLFFNTDLQKMF